MTIYDTAVPLFVAHLFCDYLAHDASIATGVPSNEALPKEAMDLGKEPALPSMVVAAKEEGSKGARRIVNVSVMLLTWLKASDQQAANVAGQTDREEAGEWTAKIDTRLRMMKDGEIDGQEAQGFRSWLAGLPAERLAGWRITKLVHHGVAAPQRNKEKRTIFHAVTLDVHLVLVREGV